MGDTRPDELHIDRFMDSAPGQRGVYASFLDLALSIGVFFGAFRVRVPASVIDAFGSPLALALTALVAFSFLNRVLLQLIFRASIGKALLSVRAIRPWDVGRPTLFDLLRSWVSGFGYVLDEESGPNRKTWRYSVGSVTRTELHEYQQGRRFFRPATPPPGQYPPAQPPAPNFPPGPPNPPVQGYPPV